MRRRTMGEGIIGRCKTVLVFGDGETARAVLSAVIVRAKAVRRRAAPTFVGVVRWETAVCDHVRDVLIPVADGIADTLKVPKVQYEIGVANIGVASAMDVGITIAGFSADVPIVLAMLSSRLGMPLPETMVSTGHVASLDGDIRFVRHVRAKLSAAINDPSIQMFVYPSIRGDVSVEGMMPREFEATESAVREAADRIRMVPVASVDELVVRVFAEPALVMGSLRGGYFRRRLGVVRAAGSVGKTVDYLNADADARFLRVLGHNLLGRDTAAARELLDAWSGCFLRRKAYPSGMGLELHRLFVSLPPPARSSAGGARLLPVPACIALSRFARESDHADVEYLYRVAGDARVWGVTPAPRASPAGGDTAGCVLAIVNSVLIDISQDHVALHVGLPIDTARACFVLDSILVENHGEFMDTLVAFYAHVLRHTQRIEGDMATEGLGPETLALLERTFGGDGGQASALAEAKVGSRGGLRFVLDAVTEQLKREQGEKYVAHVVRQAVDPLNWETKVAFMGELLRRLAPVLPPDIAVTTPERYANKLDLIVRAYVSSMDRFTAVLKAM